MKIFNLQNKIQNSLLIPFALCSIILVVCEVLTLIDIYVGGVIADKLYIFTLTLKSMIGYIICYFIVVMMTDGKRWLNAFASLLCAALFKTAFSSVTDLDFSYALMLALSLVFVLCFNKLSKLSAYIAIPFIALAGGFLFGFITNIINELLTSASVKLSGNGLISSVLFGSLNTLFSLFDSSLLGDLIFHKSMGGSLLLNDELITGVKDLFENGYRGNFVSCFLSGRFYLLFALVGFSSAVLYELKGGQKNVFLIVCICAVLSGNISLLMLFLILENIIFIAPLLLLSILSYAAAFMLKLAMGYLSDGSIIEMIISLNSRWVYLVTGGAVLGVLGYFSGRFSLEKHCISDCCNIYVPSRLAGVLKSLGGIENIIRIKDKNVEVRNPQLVNILNDNYEIKDNIIVWNNQLIAELGEYLE